MPMSSLVLRRGTGSRRASPTAVFRHGTTLLMLLGISPVNANTPVMSSMAYDARRSRVAAPWRNAAMAAGLSTRQSRFLSASNHTKPSSP
jgi:hypothetical protein